MVCDDWQLAHASPPGIDEIASKGPGHPSISHLAVHVAAPVQGFIPSKKKKHSDQITHGAALWGGDPAVSGLLWLRRRSGACQPGSCWCLRTAAAPVISVICNKTSSQGDFCTAKGFVRHLQKGTRVMSPVHALFLYSSFFSAVIHCYLTSLL